MALLLLFHLQMQQQTPPVSSKFSLDYMKALTLQQ